MKLNNLIKNKRLSKDNINILGLSENSKEIKRNYIFFFKNAKESSKSHILEAIGKGAKLIIYKKKESFDVEKYRKKCQFYEVYDIGKTMSAISRKFYGIKKNSLKIFGVTGTNGKSSVVSYIPQFLSFRNEKCAIIGTLGNGIYPRFKNTKHTTPNIIKICKNINDFVEKGIKNLAIEISSHGLDQERVYGLNFDSVIFTNLTREHLDYHKNMNNYFNAKLKLFKEYNHKKKIVSIDNYYGKKIYNIFKNDKNIKTVSIINKNADYYASNIMYSENGLDFNIHSKYGSRSVSTKLFGEFTIENILLAIATLSNNKKEYDFYTKNVHHLKPLKGRLNKYKKKDFPITFIDFAHSPDAVKKVLISIKKHFPKKDIVTVFGCGGDRSQEKRKIMGTIVDKYSKKLIITNDNPRNENPHKIAKQIMSGLKKNSDFKIILDRRLAIKNVIRKTNKNKIVLVLGKGHEKNQVIKNNIYKFSDEDEVKKAIVAK